MIAPILHVALPTPLRRYFDYLPPPDTSISQLKPGTRVKVPFGKRTLVGILVQISEHSDFPREKLKHVYALLEPEPLLTPELLQLGLWLADYYHHTPGDIFLALLPNLLRQVATEDELIAKKEKGLCCFKLTVLGENVINSTVSKITQKQMDLLTWLQQHPNASREFIKASNISLDILKRLIIHNMVEVTEIETQTANLPETPPILTQEQQQIITSIEANANEFMTWVIDGVTGSGKTEVYLRLIEKQLAQDQQVLVLIPEIGLTPQMIARFKGRFACPMAILHSGLSAKARLQAWLDAKAGTARIVLGTRSALFTPFANLGLIIVDEAHDSSFKQQDHLRYHARDVAIKRAQLLGIPIVLGSATHSLETLYAVKLGRFRYLRLMMRAGGAKPPSMTLIPIRDLRLHEGLSPMLIEAMRKHLAAGNQVLLFLNRRGFAPSLMCHHCAWIAHCKQCDAKLTLHLNPRQLQCHHCERIYQEPTSCPACHGRQLIALGLGTVRIEQALSELFPDYASIRIDRDSVRGNALEKALEQIHLGKAKILIGTQMLAKGHHFPDVTLVGILDGDSGFFSSDFRGAERMAQTILQVAGRAGRAEKHGEVLIQTRYPEHPALQALVNDGYHAFVKMTLAERQAATLPPYQSLALIRAHGKQENVLQDFLNQIKALAMKVDDTDIELLGPIPAPMGKKAGKLQFQLLLGSKNRPKLQQFLHRWLKEVEQLPHAHRLQWSLDVDPTELY